VKLLSIPEAITLGVLIVVSIVVPLVSDDSFLISLMGYTLGFSLFALSIYIVLGWMGEIPLGHSLYYGVGIYIVGYLMLNLDVPFIVATFIAMAAMFLLAMIIGFITLRLTGAYFAIVSWGLAAVAVVVIISWSDVTGGPIGMIGVPRATISGLSLSDPATYAQVSAAAVVVVLVALAFLRRSPFGRRVNGSRINRNLIRSAGANTYADRVLMFSLSAAVAALGGALTLQYLRIPTPNLLAVTTSVEGLVMVLIGGVAFLPGAVVGAVFFSMIPEQMALPAEIREITVAAAVLLIVLLAPKGIPEILRRILDLFRRPSQDEPPVGASEKANEEEVAR
jgi:branched-chain amino acid transport system permease protein